MKKAPSTSIEDRLLYSWLTEFAHKTSALNLEQDITVADQMDPSQRIIDYEAYHPTPNFATTLEPTSQKGQLLSHAYYLIPF